MGGDVLEWYVWWLELGLSENELQNGYGVQVLNLELLLRPFGASFGNAKVYCQVQWAPTPCLKSSEGQGVGRKISRSWYGI